MPFEEDLKHIEEISQKLKDPTTSLEDAMLLFEKGSKIARRVEKQLTSIERKVEILINNPKEDEDPIIEQFSEDSDL